MTLSINALRTIITISSTLLDDFIAVPGDYTTIDVVGYVSDNTTGVTKTYSDTSLITGSTDVATNGGIETINPSFFSATEFAQGVYHFVITLKGDDIETDEGCLLVEEDLGCTVDTYRLAETNQLKKLNAGIDYFILKSLTECQCNCEELIDIYNNLITQTGTVTCKTC